MIEIMHSVVVDRPVDEVFAYAGDPTNDASWATVMVESELTSQGPLGKGTAFRQVLRFLGKRLPVECEVTEYEAGRRIAFTMDMAGGANKGAHERTFERVNGGTRVTLRTSGDSSGLFKLADPVLQRVAQRQMAADLGNLKEILEAGVDPAAP